MEIDALPPAAVPFPRQHSSGVPQQFGQPYPPLKPRPRFFQFHISFGQPDNGQLHCFLSRHVLTCSHGITSEGFRSYLAVR
jgi:hypothetical protein